MKKGVEERGFIYRGELIGRRSEVGQLRGRGKGVGVGVGRLSFIFNDCFQVKTLLLTPALYYSRLGLA